MLENNIANARILGYVGDFPCNMLWRHVIPIVSVMIFVMSKHQSTDKKKRSKKNKGTHVQILRQSKSSICGLGDGKSSSQDF